VYFQFSKYIYKHSKMDDVYQNDMFSIWNHVLSHHITYNTVDNLSPLLPYTNEFYIVIYDIIGVINPSIWRHSEKVPIINNVMIECIQAINRLPMYDTSINKVTLHKIAVQFENYKHYEKSLSNNHVNVKSMILYQYYNNWKMQPHRRFIGLIDCVRRYCSTDYNIFYLYSNGYYTLHHKKYYDYNMIVFDRDRLRMFFKLIMIAHMKPNDDCILSILPLDIMKIIYRFYYIDKLLYDQVSKMFTLCIK
jgi:hypothetical protein